MFDAHPNLAIGTVLVPPIPADSGTALTLLPTQGSLFAANCPALAFPTGQSPIRGNSEIVYITGITGDRLAITRHQEGSNVRPISVGWTIVAGPTGKTFTDIETAIATVSAALTTHSARIDNPHSVTKAQVGLGNVDNTSDANKPISTATQTALNTKARLNEFNILDYGAVGDGYTNITNYTYNNAATDNTAAIEAAIDAASVSGGTVVIPPLPFMTDQLTLKDNVSIRGANRKTSTLILKKNSTNGHILKSEGFGLGGAATASDDPYAGISYFNISNLSFDGNGGNQTASSGAGDYRDQFAVVKIYGWHYAFSDVEIRQAKENGLYTEHAANWYNTYNYYQFGESSYRQLFIKNYNGAGWVNRGSHDSMANGVYLSSYSSAGFNAYAGYVQQGNGNYNAQGMVAYNLHVWGTHQTNAVYISGSNIVEGFIYAEGSTQSAIFLNASSANKFHAFAGYATHAIELNGASNGNEITVTVESNITGSLARLNTSASGNRIEQQGGYNSSASALFDLSTGGTYTGTRNTFVPSRTFTGTLFSGVPSQLDNVGESGGAVFYVDDFGAAGDDTTDDTAKIQAAVDKAPEGAIIQLGPRKYRINSPIYLTRNKTLRGTQGLRWRYVVTPSTYIKPRSTFAGLAAIIMQDKEQGGYATEQGGQRIENLNIDMSALTTGTADGIQGSGLIRDVRMEHVSVSYARGKAFRTVSYTRADASVNYPRGWQLDHCVADSGFDNGFNFNNLTDSSFNDCLAVGNAVNGFSISGSGENLFTGCRAVFNKNNGFLITGSNFGTSSFVNCSTDRNEFNGILINVTGTTTAKYPINITNPNLRRDGRNGNTGGGGYAGLALSSATSPVIVDNIAVTQGVDDNGTGTSSPVYGISSAGSDLTVTSGHIWGNTTAVNNGGSNTNLSLGEHVQLATGAVGGTKTTVKSGGTATSGYILTANGVGASPTWQAAASAPDATTSSKGIVQLAGDLRGTAASPVLKSIVRVFNVMDYGATANGSTDDTTAIQSAITDAASVGGSVYAPIGTYIVNGTINVSSGTVLTGAGMDNGTTVVGTTFKRGTASGTPMFRINGTTPAAGSGTVSAAPVRRVVLSNFTIRGNSLSDDLIQSFYSNRNHFSRIRFINTTGHAFHGVEFWDTTFDSCQFDITGSATASSVLLQNRASSTDGTLGYSSDNINRITFRGCTWEGFKSTCIELDATSNGSTHLINNITIDDCKFETTTFQNPFISATISTKSVYITNSYFAADAQTDGTYVGGAKDLIRWSGSSLVVNNALMYQGTTGVVASGVHLTGHAGANQISNITCNWSGFTPTSGGAVWIQTPASASRDAVSNIKVDVGKRLNDETNTAAFRVDPRVYVEADQTPEIVWEQTGNNPKKVTWGLTASGNMSIQPNGNILITFKKSDTTNYFALDGTNGRVGMGTVPAEVVAPTSSVHVAGSLTRHTVTKTANYTATVDDSRILVDATSGNVTITLPSAVGIVGRDYHVMKVDNSANTVTLATTSAQTIFGASTVVLSARYQGVSAVSDGANWVPSSPQTGTTQLASSISDFTTAADTAELTRARRSFYAYDDFVNNVNSPFFFFTGTGTTGTLAVADASSIGILTLNTGATTTGREGVWSNTVTLLYFDTTATWTFETKVQLSALSDPTDTYQFLAGFGDVGTGESVDGAYFSYTHGANSGKLETVTSSNSVRTRTDSGITVSASTWYLLKVVVANVAGTLTARFYINGVQVGGDVTTNLPASAARSTGYGAHIVYYAGTTTRYAALDYIEVSGNFSGGR